jgi:glyoxylase-like metal-dependent hydrolase (beta-lactamase superfamily II)
MSHYHGDHVANANLFAGATWLVRKVERDRMFSDTPIPRSDPANYSDLKTSRTVFLDKDEWDVFGDGTVVIKSTPGHTPGHQIVRIEAGADRLTISADTWNHPLQLEHPEWPSGPDNDHAGAANARRVLRREIAAHPGTIVAPTHFAVPFVTIDERGDAGAWLPA